MAPRSPIRPQTASPAVPGPMAPGSFPGMASPVARSMLPRPTAAKAARRWSPDAQQANMDRAQERLSDPKVQALLSLIRDEETGDDYSSVVGGSHFDDFSRHPNIYKKQFNSTSAGAYQFNKPTWDDVAPALGLTDFSPHSQDLGAAYLLGKIGSIDPLLNGDVAGAINAAGKRWDTMPLETGKTGSGRTVDIDRLLRSYDEKIRTGGRRP